MTEENEISYRTAQGKRRPMSIRSRSPYARVVTSLPLRRSDRGAREKAREDAR